jgi:hypothetical protein
MLLQMLLRLIDFWKFYFYFLFFWRGEPTMAANDETHSIAIVGSAGRKEDGARMNAKTFEWMLQTTRKAIADTKMSNNQIVLVSGGSSWADHVAVVLFLEDAATDPFGGLTLFLPTPFKSGAFLDTGHRDWQSNPGRTLNNYHTAFGKIIKRDTLKDIRCAEALGASLICSARGFHARNTQIAQNCDRLFAFTWAKGAEPPNDGGTRDTWDKCKAEKRHISLMESERMEIDV